VSSVRYELGFYIREDDILYSHRRKDIKSYTSDFALCDIYSIYIHIHNIVTRRGLMPSLLSKGK
jgi:hypothetical protein